MEIVADVFALVYNQHVWFEAFQLASDVDFHSLALKKTYRPIDRSQADAAV